MEDDAEVATLARLSIRRNTDGAVRADPGEWEYFGPFIWNLGNYSCDCNRELFWLKAAGEPDEMQNPDLQCTDTRYSVRLVAVEDGRMLYEDGDW